MVTRQELKRVSRARLTKFCFLFAILCGILMAIVSISIQHDISVDDIGNIWGLEAVQQMKLIYRANAGMLDEAKLEVAGEEISKAYSKKV